MSYLLRHDPLPPDQLERVEHIDQAGQQLLGLIDDIRFLQARVRAVGVAGSPVGQGSPGTRGCNDRAVASAKGLSVRIEADSLPERLFGDAERLSQVC